MVGREGPEGVEGGAGKGWAAGDPVYLDKKIQTQSVIQKPWG